MKAAYRNHIAANGRKTDVPNLLLGLLASDGDPVGLVRDMHERIYAGGIGEDQFDRLLFSPSTIDIRTLPPAILDTKEAVVPPDLIPATRNDLDRFLRRMMVATGRDFEPCELVGKWFGGQSPDCDFDDHVGRLWQLRGQERGLYTALVGGRFGSVIRHLQQSEMTTGARRRLRDLLVGQALIWCAHDVQLVVARLTKTPDYGHLLPANRSLEGSLNDLRDRRIALDKVLDLFFGSGEWRQREIQPAWSGVNLSLTQHADPIIRRTAKHVGRADRNVDTRVTPADVAAMMQRIAAELRVDPLLDRTATPRTRNVEAKAYATGWYGLSRLAAISVAIRRLIQAEQQLPDMVDAVIAGHASAITILRPLSTYLDAKLPPLSVARQVGLLAFYRDAVLADGSDNNSDPWKAIKASRNFLRKRGLRRSGDHHGSASDPRRAFYLLDVIPEHRFAIG